MTEIIKVDNDLRCEDFLPRYDFHFDESVNVDEHTATVQKDALNKFLKQNYEIFVDKIKDMNTDQISLYFDGFRDAIAFTRLWIDSLNT